MLRVIEAENSAEWDRIVKSFADHDVYWLNGYPKAFQIHGDGIPQLFYFEKGETRGINVVMKRDIGKDNKLKGLIPDNQLWDFSTPYGYGGWIIEGPDMKALDDEYTAYCRANSVVSEFVRFHPMIKNHDMASGFYDVVPLGETVAIYLQPEDKIWENFTGKNRNHVRKAEKSGVTIGHGLTEELFQSFVRVYNETMDRDDADSYYYFGKEFYDSILNDLSDNAQIFYAEYNGMIIAASIMLYANGWMNYHLSGSMREFASLAPINLLLFEAAKWGSQQGFKALYLGGGVGSAEDSLLIFKKAFYRGEYQRFHIGKKIFDQKKYDELVALRSDVEQSNYFPKYRA